MLTEGQSAMIQQADMDEYRRLKSRLLTSTLAVTAGGRWAVAVGGQG